MVAAVAIRPLALDSSTLSGLTSHFVTEDSYEAAGYNVITNEDVCREATIALGSEYPLLGDAKFAGSGTWATDRL